MRLKRSLRSERISEGEGFNFTLDIRPYSYQKEILEKLQVEIPARMERKANKGIVM